MKNIYFTFVLSALILNTGCSVRSSESVHQDVQKQIDQINENNSKALSDEINLTNAGGQPAHVILKGQGLKKNNFLNTQYYSVSSLGGVRCDSEMRQPVDQGQVASLETDEVKSEINLEKTFVNIGCGKNIEKKLTAGLKDATITEKKKYISNKYIWMVNATKIFICGNIDLSKMISVHFQADEVYMSNAVLLTDNKMTATLSLSTKRLILDGANSFSSLIKEEKMPSLISPVTEVTLNVETETQGSGVLSITAKGADCVKDEKE